MMFNSYIICGMMGVCFCGAANLVGEERYQQEEVVYDDGQEEGRPCGVCSRCRARRQWHVDYYAEKRFQETGWASRRGEELSDQLSR